ncbi:DNA-binding transcriptional LysR family regulator [Nocardioides cavernae]|uniref:DNA-binding transcriptional LysR family regulator n=1 Tax=Nocardioides cavernae TaxID=1921566 RepID=A0A7Y9H4P2_9ACTN|nr:LysR family transcriptional regulator [Nocardioides cavernae]NYE37865.1 DNA-binding transcriptional LysR family regulator [Nocardioides cavernae]
MERRQLEFFLAIAEAGSFTRAAQALHVAQPSLSHSMRTLETELGSPLFERHGRGVRLTAAGEALLAPARRAVRSFGLAASAVRGVADGGSGTLRLVSSTSWAVHPLVGLIGEFRRQRPQVRFEVTDPAARAVVLDQVRTGQVDFGLVDGAPPSGSLASLELAEQQLLAVLPPGQDPGLSTTIERLARHGLIGTPRGTALRGLLDGCLEAAGRATEVMVETAHAASVVPLVVSGAGATVLPEGMAVDAATKGARVARLEPGIRATVSLVWRTGGPHGLAADFLELVREHHAGRVG